MGFLLRTRSGLDRGNDIWISPAAANVAAHPLADFIGRQIDCTCSAQIGGNDAYISALCFLEQRDRRTDLAGRTVAALESIMFKKSLLDRMQRVALGKPLNG